MFDQTIDRLAGVRRFQTRIYLWGRHLACPTGDLIARACFKSLIIKASVLKIPLIPLNKGDFERFGSLLIKEG
jgi:hypothetical protein